MIFVLNMDEKSYTFDEGKNKSLVVDTTNQYMILHG